MRKQDGQTPVDLSPFEGAPHFGGDPDEVPMRLLLSALALGLAALPALSATTAEQPMSAEAFERYSTGKTLTYGANGAPYGIERYLPGRQVVWAFVGQECRYGQWYPAGDEICFVYEGDPLPQCWVFYATPGGLRAHFSGDPNGEDLVEVNQSSETMPCPGPKVGA